MWESDTESGQPSSSWQNVALGLECSIHVKNGDLVWDWTIFVKQFLDPIIVTEELRRCWSDSQSKLGIPDFGDAALLSIE